MRSSPPRARGAAAIVLFVVAVVLGLTHPTALAAPEPAPRAAVFDVRDYGAKGDGSTNDTPAVNKAVNAASSAGGGTVRFPAGTYKSKNTIHMKSNVTLQVDTGATIQGSSADTYDPPESNPYDKYQDYGHSHFHNAMIYGDRLTNIGFVGGGVIDGGGNLITGNPKPGEADKILSLTRCDGLRIGDGLTLRRGGHFAALVNGCKNVTSDHLTIDTASDRDGWNIISTTDVTVTNANIKANDDALVFKSDYALGAKLPNGHVRVSDSYLSARCCNALMFGSETCGDFSDYRFEKIRIEGADKSGLGMVSMDGAKISDVHYRDITMRNVHSPVMQKIGTRRRCGNSPGVGSISDVTYDDITATGNSPSFSPTLWGETGHRISGVTFNHVDITVPGGNGTMSTAVPSNDPNDYNPKSIGTRPAYGWYLHNADHVRFTDSSVKFAAADGRPALIADAASDIRLTRFTAQRGADSPHDVGFQNVTGYCLTDSRTTSGGALRVSSTGSTENCGGTAARTLDVENPRQDFLRSSVGGLFLHWGLRTAPAHTSCGAWEHDVTSGGWTPDYWVNEARKLHTQYLVLATFHSRLGYARPWPSKIPGSCSTERDFLGELITAAKAKGMKVILYMTDDPQWHAEGGHEWLDSAAYSAYKGKNVDLTTRDGFGQFSYDNFFEVMDRYPDLGGFWIDNDNAYWESHNLYAQIYQKRPNYTLSNNNEDTPIMDMISNEQKTGMTPAYDYPQALYTAQPRLTEADFKLPSTGAWWYDGSDPSVDRRLTLGRLVTNAGSSVKALMAETAQVNGKFPANQAAFNNFADSYLDPIGESLHGTEGGGYMYGGLKPGFWNDGAHGVTTISRTDPNRQYIHVLTPPGTSTLRIRDNGWRIASVVNLRTGKAVSWSQSGGVLTLTGLGDWDPYDTVFKVTGAGRQGILTGVKVTASSSASGHTGSAAGDGDHLTYWDNDKTLPVSLTFDLGSTKKVQYIGLNQREDSVAYARSDTEQSARIKDYKVYLSNDGSTWGSAVRTGRLPSRRGIQGIDLTAADARYVRLEVDTTWAAASDSTRYKRLRIEEAWIGTSYATPSAFTTRSDNGQSLRPAMGWSSWSFVRRRPTEAKIRAQADALASSGLKDHGFVYVNLDDFWQKCDSNGFVVDSYGRWAVDTDKFPGGIKALADYVHSKGLKFGFYVTPGIAKNAVTRNTPVEGTSYYAKDIADTSKTEKNYNCKNMYYIDYSRPGAQEFVNSWAKQFASWGVDYLKIDGVGSQDIPDVQAWDKALRATGRPITLALSNNLPIANASTWRQLANSWRTQGDVECYCGSGSDRSGYPLTDWSHVSARFTSAANWQPYAGPGGWNDLDSLEIGNGDQAGLTADQRRSHFTLWAMAGAPLLLGTDLTHLDPVDEAMLANDRLIDVDQDGVAAKRLVNSGVKQVWSKREHSGDYVVALFNTGTSGNATVGVNWSQVGFTGSGDVTDLWSGSHKGVIADSYSATLRPGETRLIRVKPVDSTKAAASPGFAVAPYEYLGWGNPQSPTSVMSATGVKWFTLAFILSDGSCNPKWDGSRPLTGGTDQSTINAIRNAGGDVMVSVGGWSGAKLGEKCSSASALAGAYQKVVNAYRLKALDIDIENTEWSNATVRQRVVDALKTVKAANPGLKTVITFGTTTGGPDSTGVDMIKRAADSGLANDVWCIMPFDFGGGTTDMGTLTTRAMDGLKGRVKAAYGYSDATAYAHIGLSSMNGKTDDSGERVRLADFRTMLAYAQQHHIGRLTYWSVNRDRPCGSGTDGDSCSGVTQQPYDYLKVFAQYTG
ncbi:glycosyl hydrolase family 28 protein [Streptomyces sp. BK340]|uniref:glycosyl hydrolase family 28 protein n=1 Tax=Streptomyces sp. BK340 TaxID=2572903 RepID=UPI0011A00CCC|nr:glycosyl hydrolase family 28 protein [Streptomyces sp. BK340]TVZ81810.1 alpha-L-fucosidase-like protein [Streptomyces sp. BK340]